MSIAPPALVTGAPRPQLPYGLFSVLAPREGSADRWEGGGVLLESIGCPPASTGLISPYSCEQGILTVGLPKTFESHSASSIWAQFTIYQEQVCSPIGNSLERSQQIARERLALFEERLVEEQLWASFADLNTDLEASFTVASDKTAVLAAFAALEEESSDLYGTQGIVHLPRKLASYALGQGALEVRQGRLFTLLGTPAVAGSGYANTGKAYWTPQIIGYRSEVFTSSNRSGDLLDRAQNDLYGVAERNWLVAYDTSCEIVPTPVTTP